MTGLATVFIETTGRQVSYVPQDYARVLNDYIGKAGIDTSKHTIYGMDIGALPALLLALEKPDIARTIIVGDFAPFNSPHYMYEPAKPEGGGTLGRPSPRPVEQESRGYPRIHLQKRLPSEAHFEVLRELKDDMYRG